MDEQIRQDIKYLLSQIDNQIQEIEKTRCVWIWTIFQHILEIKKNLKNLKRLQEKKIELSVFNEIKTWFLFIVPIYLFPFDIIAYIFLLHNAIVTVFSVTIEKEVTKIVDVSYYWFWKTPKTVVETIVEVKPPSSIFSWILTILIIILIFNVITYLVKMYLLFSVKWLSHRLKKYYNLIEV